MPQDDDSGVISLAEWRKAKVDGLKNTANTVKDNRKASFEFSGDGLQELERIAALAGAQSRGKAIVIGLWILDWFLEKRRLGVRIFVQEEGQDFMREVVLDI